MRDARLVPELYCSDIEASLRFYIEVLGFRVVFARPEEKFAYLEFEGAELMLEELVEAAQGRRWITGELVRPFGRGVNFMIEAADVDAVYGRVRAAGATVFLDMEEKWYRRDEVEVGNRQFIVQDPDGYLLRFAQDLGERAVAGHQPSNGCLAE